MLARPKFWAVHHHQASISLGYVQCNHLCPRSGLHKRDVWKDLYPFYSGSVRIRSLTNYVLREASADSVHCEQALRSMDVKVENGGRTSTPSPLTFLIPGSAFGSPESLILLCSIVRAIKGSVKHYIQQEDIRVRHCPRSQMSYTASNPDLHLAPTF